MKDTPSTRPRRSLKVRGRIRTVVIRPAPEWVDESGAGPVNRKWPAEWSSSTSRRTASKVAGTRRHSSSRTGGSSRAMMNGSASMRSRSVGESSRRTVALRRRAVAVLPTPWGPFGGRLDGPVMSEHALDHSSATLRSQWRIGVLGYSVIHRPSLRVVSCGNPQPRSEGSLLQAASQTTSPGTTSRVITPRDRRPCARSPPGGGERPRTGSAAPAGSTRPGRRWTARARRTRPPRSDPW